MCGSYDGYAQLAVHAEQRMRQRMGGYWVELAGRFI